MFERLAFTPSLLTCPALRRHDAIATLRHFAIITYAVPPERLRPFVDPRFDLETVIVDGQPRALLSIVPFEDQDFRFVGAPRFRWRFGQMNYRIYVRRRQGGARAVWFLGTTLDSWTVLLPRYWWRLPWHRGHIAFECEQDARGTYSRYRVTARSAWAPASCDLVHEPGVSPAFPGFPDVETALVVLTHPLTGYYTRRDGHLGSYSVWHERLSMHSGRIAEARFGLLDRLAIVPFAEQQHAYSVLIQPVTEFVIQLPPSACPAAFE